MNNIKGHQRDRIFNTNKKSNKQKAHYKKKNKIMRKCYQK